MTTKEPIQHHIARLQAILQDNACIRHAPSKTGAVNFNKLAQYKTSPYMSTRKQEDSGQQYHAAIIMDASGSMAGANASQMLTAFKQIYPMLKQTMNSLHVYDFNYAYTKYEEQDIKTLLSEEASLGTMDSIEYRIHGSYATDELFHPKTRISHTVARNSKQSEQLISEGYGKVDGGGNGGCNIEIPAIMDAIEQMNGKPGKKIIILLTDGEVAYDCYSEATQLIVYGKNVTSFFATGTSKESGIFNSVTASLFKRRIEQLFLQHDIIPILIGINTQLGDHYPQKYCSTITSKTNAASHIITEFEKHVIPQ